jgi:hypothetical protein
MKELKFKVRFGYTAMDRVSIGTDELEKALYAQKFGVPVLLGGKQISGKEIKVIEPDYNYYTGWYDSYQPSTSDDYAQLERDCPKCLDETIRHYRERVDLLLATGRKQLVGKNVALPELDKPTVEQLPVQVQKLVASVADKMKV